MAPVANVAAYHFARIDDPQALRAPLREWCAAAGLKGTVLLATEGINAFLAGPQAGIEEVLARLRALPGFCELEAKWSGSETVPFRRLWVRVKPEIVTLRRPGFDRAATPAPRVSAQTLRRWLDRGCDDDGRPVTLLDTRNAWEVAVGSFDGALDPGIARFSQFAGRLEDYAHLRDETVVTFCTGGIRCEKAAPLMVEQGFARVYQLEGGILRWFEACGGAHWRGDCAVFDDRKALRPDLTPIPTTPAPRAEESSCPS
ncbi:MAG: hypothetical protein FGM40_05200 [Rhodocyclaceae bacterium]|nr:hypothetical protein [Rhodocyclaceae bacterium]